MSEPRENLGVRRHANDPETPVLRVMACVKCGDRHTVDISEVLAKSNALRQALERELNSPWTSIRTTAARALFDKAKASSTQEVTITAQELAVLLPAIESSAVFLALRAALVEYSHE